MQGKLNTFDWLKSSEKRCGTTFQSAMSSDNKKRGRNDLDGDCGEEPLAKRINNLHLNNHNSTHQGHHQQYYQSQAEVEINRHSSHQQHLQQQQQDYHQNHHNLYQQQQQPEAYDPELTERENPHYFQKNKVLYQLHMERERRGRNHQT